VEFNVETLKNEIAEYLESSEFAVFHTVPHGFESGPSAHWDTENNPDFREFLEVARKAGVKIVCFGTEELDEDSLDQIEQEIETGGLDREEQRDFQSRLRSIRAHQGMTAAIELAFQYETRAYVFEVRAPWHDEYINLEDDVYGGSLEDTDEDDDSLGGYYSNN
jgi:hypothetical protein